MKVYYPERKKPNCLVLGKKTKRGFKMRVYKNINKMQIVTIVLLSFLLFGFPLYGHGKSNNNSDQDITKAVQKKIRSNLFYSVFDWVTVETHEGIVTLNGYTHLPWDKSYFEKIAKKVDGVKSVIDKIEKTNGSDELRYKAAEAIYNSPEFEKYAFMKDPPVHIIVINNRIVLKGSVESEVERSHAEMLLEWHTDAFKINNELTLEE